MTVVGSPKELLTRACFAIAIAAALTYFLWNTISFFPNAHGRLGHDYGLFMPWLLTGYYWQRANSVFDMPEFVASFCGGVPFLFNPQSIFESLPQWLMPFISPVDSMLVTTIVFGLIGGASMYAFLLRCGDLSRAAAAMGAVIFLLNGFFSFRMIVGHVTYHAFMLVPVLALAVLTPFRQDPGPRSNLVRRVLERSALGAVVIGYVLYSGATNVVLPLGYSLVLLLVALRLFGRLNPNFLWIGAGTLVFGFALSAYKLLPALAYLSEVTRPTPLQLTDNAIALLGGLGVSLFAPQALAYLPDGLMVTHRHELEYGVGLVPLVALGLGAIVAWRRADLGRLCLQAGAQRMTLLVLLCVLLAIPAAVNIDLPGMRYFLLHIPIIKSMSLMLRFWAAYIPVLCFAAAVLLDYVARSRQRRVLLAACGVGVTTAQAALTDTTYYAEQSYDPTPIVASYDQVRGGAPIPPITVIGDPWEIPNSSGERYSSRNDAIVDGMSAVPCYEPMFGYNLEVFPREGLAPGPILQSTDGFLNLRNPVCYVFGEANQCMSGDEFRVDQQAEARNMAAYKPFEYRWPAWQYAATALTIAGLVIAMVLLATAVLRRAARRN